jgi:hypothetical protein
VRQYSVERLQNEWVICVGDARVLTCRTKRIAVETVRRAIEGHSITSQSIRLLLSRRGDGELRSGAIVRTEGSNH